MLPKLVDLLDLRPRVIAEESPIEESVNIPLPELRNRLHELPRPNARLRVYHPGIEPLPPVLAERPTASVAALPHVSPECRPLCRLWEHNDLLALLRQEPGRALDLGCGSGRDAVALACLGWQVTACDHLPKSLELARDLESRYSDGTKIEWVEVDLRKGPLAGAYDLVTAFFFWKPESIVQASHQLKPGGTLLIEMFTFADQERHGKPKHPTNAEELRALFPHLEEVKTQEAWRPSGRHTVQAVFRRT